MQSHPSSRRDLRKILNRRCYELKNEIFSTVGTGENGPTVVFFGFFSKIFWGAQKPNEKNQKESLDFSWSRTALDVNAALEQKWESEVLKQFGFSKIMSQCVCGFWFDPSVQREIRLQYRQEALSTYYLVCVFHLVFNFFTAFFLPSTICPQLQSLPY